MGANQGSTDSRRYFKLIAKAEKCDTKTKRAIVEVVKKGEKYEDGEWFSSLSGYITKAHVKDFVHDGVTHKKCVVEITDAEGICQLEFTFNFTSFGLINALLNADFTKELQIEAYITKKGFVGAGVRYVGEAKHIEWLIALPDQPKGVKYKTPGGKEETDYSNVKAFWLDKFSNEVVTMATKEKKVKVYDVAEPHDAPISDAHDDLPF